MLRVLIVLIPLLLALTAAACDSGDDSPGATSPTPTETVGDDDLSPTASEDGTPIAGTTPGVTRVTPLDQGEFSDRYGEEEMTIGKCAFDAAAGLVDCAENGIYQPDPPPAGGADCDILLLDDEPIAVACETQEPLFVTYYEISP